MQNEPRRPVALPPELPWRQDRDLFVTFAIGVVAFLAAAVFDLNERFVQWAASTRFESFIELSEIPVALSIAFAATAWYANRRRRQFRAEVTAHKQTMAQLELALQNARAASEAKSRFILNMNHELRTPLNAIIGLSDVMANDTASTIDEQTHRQYLGTIRLSGQHLLDTIDTIIDYSRHDAAMLSFSPMPVDVASVVSDVGRLVAQELNAARLKLTLDVAPAIRLEADEARLRQALLNLLSNSIKFTPANGEIRVSAREERGEVRITVVDTGVGIAPADLRKVTEPFYQSDTALDRQASGVGMGLALAKRLIELHNGTLMVESALNTGTTVTIFLPVGQRAATRHGDVRAS